MSIDDEEIKNLLMPLIYRTEIHIGAFNEC